MIKIFIKPLSNEPSIHIEAIIDHFEKRNVSINNVQKSLHFYFLPLGSIIILEAIKSIGLWAFIRPDLRVIHIPRGGSSLKVGWRTLNRLNWRNRLRLQRRNMVCMRNQWQVSKFSWEENFNEKKYSICAEPLDDFLRQKRKIPNSMHISLSECWSENQIIKFVSLLKSDSKFKGKLTFISLHPLAKVNSKALDKLDVEVAEFGKKGIPEYFITDCVSLIYASLNLGIKTVIVNERQTHDRRLLENQNKLFDLNSMAWQRLNETECIAFLPAHMKNNVKLTTSPKSLGDAIGELYNNDNR